MACSHQKPPEVASNGGRTAAVNEEAKPMVDVASPRADIGDFKVPEPDKADASKATTDIATDPEVEARPDSGAADKPEVVDKADKPEVADAPPEAPQMPYEAERGAEQDKPAENAPEEEEKPSRKGDLTLQKMTLTNQIVDRLPDETRTEWVIGRDAEFLVWMEWKNSGPEVTLETVWKQDGKEKWRFPFQVGSGKTWRTWVKRRVNKKDAGAWTVQVVDSGGHVYRSLRFSIR